MDAIRRRIATRALLSGDRLPSIRGLAAAMRVSPSTVVEAYDRLAAEGLIRARPGSGFFVSDAAVPLVLATAPDPVERAIDPFWVSRQSLDAGPEIARPGCGWLPPDWMPVGALRRAARSLSRAPDAVLTDYGPVRGCLRLRAHLARRFAAEGLNAGPDDILLTGSGTQSLDLVCRLLLRPGDTVLVDDPCYFNFRAILAAHRVAVVGVPMTAAGPDTDRFAEIAAAHRPRLYLTNSALHNPTGATLIAPVAHRVLVLCARHDITVVEDEVFADFEPEPSVRLAVLGGSQRAVRIGSFSKTLSASVRCGYVAARRDWIEGLIDIQVATSFGGLAPMAAEIVHSVLADGSYRKHMEALRRRLAYARREIGDRLENLGYRPFLRPRGGFTLWCEVPGPGGAASLARAALERGVVLAPGEVFSVSGEAGRFMRFNVAQMGEALVFEVLAEGAAAAESVPDARATLSSPG
ncbi:PLP-dependent aminotransferase family protein [Aureimonas sp. ME7]|uniref:aminotransferase-like domain-containing protein n=1 Tax=Aureimonas sp. ME7 TaxID=2744252 RepID=UPI0015F6A07A|nr:PLP-dependent aminotransferase family protein [Aureimonas sp. ME7]